MLFWYMKFTSYILLSLFIWYSSGVIEYQIKYALPYRAVARILFLAADFVWCWQFLFCGKVLDYTTTIYIIIVLGKNDD